MKTFLLALLSCMILFSAALAEDKKMDEAAMMDMWMKIASPAKEHAELVKCTGDWSYTSKSWWVPGQPAQDGSGNRKASMIFGGRYLKFEDEGDMGGGMKMKGMGLLGFDNFRKEYGMFWIDDMSTGMVWAQGTASADGKTVTLMGKMDDPMSGRKDVPVKYVTKFVSDTHHEFEIWDDAGSPNERKMLEIHYTKK